MNAKPKDQAKQDEVKFTLIKSGKAEKLSPRHPGSIGYEIVKLDESQVLAIRITVNSSGGFFSREFIPLNAIADELNKVESDKPLKSGLLRGLFKSGSSNNAGFLCAALRAEDVLLPAPNSLYQHLKGHPVADWIAAFTADPKPKAKTKSTKPTSAKTGQKQNNNLAADSLIDSSKE
ncbi:MAG: hypothetical protein V7731_18190 [Amphritea sp.]